MVGVLFRYPANGYIMLPIGKLRLHKYCASDYYQWYGRYGKKLKWTMKANQVPIFFIPCQSQTVWVVLKHYNPLFVQSTFCLLTGLQFFPYH